ncbi:MAG: Hpt domain-containing protein [Phycisphaeraceae bacterium]|nr:Hpt domain-containing protein [Phycisphaeraceae bacterium]
MPPGPSPSQQPILSTHSSDPEMGDLIRVFVAEMPAKVERLRDCWSEQRFDELRRIAHQLKGASGGYGFEQVGDSAARVEHAIEALSSGRAETTLQQLRAQVDALIALCGRVRAE